MATGICGKGGYIDAIEAGSTGVGVLPGAVSVMSGKILGCRIKRACRFRFHVAPTGTVDAGI